MTGLGGGRKAPELTADELARVAAFDAAPQLAESAPMTRAVLALAEELEKAGRLPDLSEFDRGVGAHQRDTAARLRTTVATVLAADPEPRDAVIERMARAMWAAEHGVSLDGWALVVATTREHWRRLAAAALDASRGETQ